MTSPSLALPLTPLLASLLLATAPSPQDVQATDSTRHGRSALLGALE